MNVANRWKFRIDENFKLTAEPEIESMISFVSNASKELQEKIMEREEMLVLTAISNDGLQRLIDLCVNELTRRKAK